MTALQGQLAPRPDPAMLTARVSALNPKTSTEDDVLNALSDELCHSFLHCIDEIGECHGLSEVTFQQPASGAEEGVKHLNLVFADHSRKEATKMLQHIVNTLPEGFVVVEASVRQRTAMPMSDGSRHNTMSIQVPQPRQ